MKLSVKLVGLVVLVLLVVAVVVVSILISSEIGVVETRRDMEPFGGLIRMAKSTGVLSLQQDTLHTISDRFPYLVAIVENSTEWSFTCFGSLIIMQWVVTSAHCRNMNATQRVLLLYDYVHNFVHTYPVLSWILHEKYNPSDPVHRHDIAIVKLNAELNPYVKLAIFDDKPILSEVEAVVWKTVTTMDKKQYLINDITRLNFTILRNEECYIRFGNELDDSTICMDISKQECFVGEFGPVFIEHKVVGVLNVSPQDCDLKMAIFTNVSYYANWILEAAHPDRRDVGNDKYVPTVVDSLPWL